MNVIADKAAERAPVLTVRDLSHGFKGGAAVVAIPHLALPAGGLTVLTGASGSGKTTLLYLLAGLMPVQLGAIDWAGTDLAQLSERRRDRWRRTHAGFLFQDFHLLPELSPLDNVLLPVWFSAFSARSLRPRAEALLADFGVPLRKRTADLSRGEQQRTALARALLTEPAVIFADEPTASLDAAAGQVVAQSLRDLARGGGRMVIAASHDPTLVALADRRLHLEHGKLAQCG